MQFGENGLGGIDSGDRRINTLQFRLEVRPSPMFYFTYLTYLLAKHPPRDGARHMKSCSWP